MNDRLQIAATILSNGTTKIQRALEMADDLIAEEKRTRAIIEGEPPTQIKETIAHHVKVGDLLMTSCFFKEVVNIDYSYNHTTGDSYLFFYFDDSTSEKFHWKDIVTIKEKPNG